MLPDHTSEMPVPSLRVVVSSRSHEPRLAPVAGEYLAAISRVAAVVPSPAIETLPTVAAKAMEDQSRRNPDVAGEK